MQITCILSFKDIGEQMFVIIHIKTDNIIEDSELLFRLYNYFRIQTLECS